MNFSERQFRDTLGCFVTGITVVSCLGKNGSHVGVTINSFNSVSLEPPLVLFSIGKAAFSFDDITSAQHLVINVLSEVQASHSSRFAEPHGDKWRDIAFSKNAEDVPVLENNLATLHCVPWAQYDGGDHTIMVCRVTALEHRDDLRPLVYFHGSYAALEG